MSGHQRSKGSAYRLSTTIALVLAVLTVIEFFVAVYAHQFVVVLLLLATFKAVLVLNYFMHVSRLWTPEEEH